MKPKTATFQELAGTFPKKRLKKPITTQQMKPAAQDGAVRRFKKAVDTSNQLTRSVSEGGRSNQQ
ncbi:MAG: hypothetical protein ACKV2Q_08315 [Planctomycetaceae bacterium]